jgi:hypothetical protein
MRKNDSRGDPTLLSFGKDIFFFYPITMMFDQNRRRNVREKEGLGLQALLYEQLKNPVK